MLVDEDGVYHAVSIPPPKVRGDVIARLKEDARNFLPPQMWEILSRVSKPFFTPIYDLLVDRMIYGRVVLIGDAAAVARPHVGMGIAKAGTDAEVLVDSIASHPDLFEGLARFERDRLPVAGKAVAQGRSLGEYMLDHVTPETGVDDAHWREFHSIPGILKHTASSAFLRSV
jgi:2-polyprenyl-6-methoxyphenol hydroxylase-like FAD-dependent oxidoreductase